MIGLGSRADPALAPDCIPGLKAPCSNTCVQQKYELHQFQSDLIANRCLVLFCRHSYWLILLCLL
jgi:hypothetical protein